MNNNEKPLLRVDDKFQNYISENYPELNKYSLLNEILFYGIFGYYYYFGPIQDSTQNFLILKYIISILVLRYVFNSLTNLTDTNTSDKNKKTSYFQLNSKLAIFIIIILFLSKNENSSTLSGTTLAIIASYTLLTTAINIDTTTVDNIMSCILVLYIYSLNLLS